MRLGEERSAVERLVFGLAALLLAVLAWQGLKRLPQWRAAGWASRFASSSMGNEDQDPSSLAAAGIPPMKFAVIRHKRQPTVVPPPSR